MAAAKKILVIVESPSKAKTIGKFLGSRYKVIASVGHVRDLPKSKLGIDIDNDFEPQYISIRGKGDIIKELKKEAKNASKVYLATDPDREGEAISWHLAFLLGIDQDTPCRIVFNEITSKAIKEAIKHPRPDRYQPGGCTAGTPCAGSSGRISDQPAALEKSAERT